jgi:hypothetical protein
MYGDSGAVTWDLLNSTKAVQGVEAGGVARVDGGALVPISPVHVDRIGHPGPRNDERERKGDRLTWISFAGGK